MSGGFPTGWDVCAGTDYGAQTASSVGTLLTASASTNVKGAWTQLGAAASYDISLLHVNMQGATSARTGLIDIGIGAGGSQQVLFANMSFRPILTNGTCDFVLPADIPAGTAIWARIQSATASEASHSIKINGYSGGFTHQAGAGGGEAQGISTATSIGTLVTASATANVKGSYAALTASTAHDYSGVVLCIDPLAAGTVNYLVDFAIGASGSEMVIAPNMSVSVISSRLFLPIAIPAGTRVAARCQSSTLSDTLHASIIGLFR
jgi:hypothetical protein